MPSSIPPFRFWRFFFSLKGRVSRRAIWLFVLPIEVVMRGGREVFQLLAFNHGLGNGHLEALYIVTAIFGLARLVLAWPIFAVLFKRLHDRNLSGLIALPYFLEYVVAIGIAFGFLVHSIPMQHVTLSVLRYSPYVSLAFVTILVLVLAILPGSKGTNGFGGPPRQSLTASEIF